MVHIFILLIRSFILFFFFFFLPEQKTWFFSSSVLEWSSRTHVDTGLIVPSRVLEQINTLPDSAALDLSPLNPAFLTALWDLLRITLLTRHRGPTRLCPGPLQLKFQAPPDPRGLIGAKFSPSRGAPLRENYPCERGEERDTRWRFGRRRRRPVLWRVRDPTPPHPQLPEGRLSPRLRVRARQLALAF